MTSKERVKTTFAHQEPDRVPLFEIYIADRPLAAILGKPPTDGATKLRQDMQRIRDGDRDGVVRDHIRAVLEAHRLLGFDLIDVQPSYGAEPWLPEEIAPNTWRYDDPAGFWSVVRWDEGPDVFFGVDSAISQEGIEGFRRFVEHLESLPTDPDLSVFDPLVYVLEHESEMFILGDADVTCPTLTPWVTVYLEALILAPDLVERYMDVTMEKELKGLRYQLSLGVDGVIGRNDWYGKNGPFMSPKHFRRFIMPYLKMIVDECHKHGVPYIEHLDGNTALTADELWVELGIDGYHAIEPTAGMDIAEMKARYGHHLTLLGNIDCGHTLTFGTEAEIVDEVRRILRAAAPGGGYVFASSNSFHGHVPLENILTVVKAVKEFGTYPIDL
jgi:uroporphyrinogen decarboxylase